MKCANLGGMSEKEKKQTEEDIPYTDAEHIDEYRPDILFMSSFVFGKPKKIEDKPKEIPPDVPRET